MIRKWIVSLALLSPLAHASFSGTFKSSTDYYPSHLGEATDDLTPFLSLDLNGRNKLSKRWRLQYRLLAMSNLESEFSPEKFYADAPEAYVEYKRGSLKLALGMDTLNWGVADISSPSDVVNPTVLFHPMRTIKRGAPMLALGYDRESFRFQGIYIPRQQRSLLPSEDSRWLPRNFLRNVGNQEGRILLPEFLEYQYEGYEVLDRALDQNYGARISGHFGSLDVYAMHFEGVSPSPKAGLTVNATVIGGNEALAQTPIYIRPIYYRVRTSGLAAVYAGESWIFRAESTYQHTLSDHPTVQPWSQQNVVAAETNLDIGTSSMTWLAQFYYTRNPQEPDNLISSSYRLFDRTILLGARWPYSEELLITLSALHELNAHGTFFMASFENKLSDSMRWGLSWRDFSAPEDGLIKTFDRNDHATLELTYYF